MSLLSACFDGNKKQAEQLAQMQAKIEEQERQNSLMKTQMQQEADRVRHEEELRKIREEAKIESEIELKSKLAKEQIATSQPKPQADIVASKKSTKDEKGVSNNKTPTTNDKKTSTSNKTALKEKVVRYPATVVTTSGYGELSLRGEPSAKGIQVSTISDGDEVTVIAETNQCETIGKVQGCWVKVDAYGNKGYMFNGYLQKELLSQAEKEAMLYGGEFGDVVDDR